MLPSEIPRLATDPPERVFPGVSELLSFLRLLSQMDLCLYLFCLSLYLLYFVLRPFKDNGLLFWVPNVLCQHSEVVLWNLLGVQMFFRWICGGESGLPVLFLCHLRTASWMLSFKPTFSPSSFTFIKRLFNSSISAIRVVSSTYLRLLIFLPAILIPARASSSTAFHMMYMMMFCI